MNNSENLNSTTQVSNEIKIIITGANQKIEKSIISETAIQTIKLNNGLIYNRLLNLY